MNGPPTVPVDVRPPAGVTERAPGVDTVSVTPRVAFPVPLVVFVNVTVSV